MNVKKHIVSKRGSAIIMALVTITVLMLLGLAVIALSMGTLKANAADATTNDAYYAAEAGVNSAIEQVKTEVSRQYSNMKGATGALYDSYYNNFFADISSNAALKFIEPSIDGITIETTFSLGSHDASQDAQDILISCTSMTADGTKYVVNGSVKVKRIDLRSKNWLIEDHVVYTGASLNLGNNSGMTASGNDVKTKAVKYVRSDNPLIVNNGNLVIDPTAGDDIKDALSYPSYTDPVITDLDIYVTTNNYVFKSTYPAPVGIKTAPGINISFRESGVPAGTIHGQGNITFSDIENVYADVYCDGNLNVSSGTYYGNLYCRGNMTLSNGVFKGNIICDGNVTITSGNYNGLILAGGAVTISNASSVCSVFASGVVKITSVGASGGIIYSSTELRIGNLSSSTIFFSAGDIVITGGSSVTGMLIAKDMIYYSPDNSYMTINYSQSLVDQVKADPRNTFFFGGSGSGGSGTVDYSNVILGQSISAAGRKN